jgi:SAM-dependent methyltransferase
MPEGEMASPLAAFVGTIPENYDRGLGPHIFVDFASDLATRVAALAPTSVLELAAGTGILTRALRDRLPPGTAIMATDLNGPMLDVARGKVAEDDALSYRVADATELPFADEAYDLVACQFGVMFFPDKDKSYREVWRVLAPGGRYVFNVWDSFASNRFAPIANETIGSFFDMDPPGFYRLPFSYHLLDPIKESLLAAGFGNIDLTVVALAAEIPDASLFARGLVFGNPVIDEIRARAGADPERIQQAVAAALREAFGQDPGRMKLQAIVIRAQKP